MSGDVQPRKRKDKRRKKEEPVDDVPGNFSSDEHIHIHKDDGTGGNIFAKIVFFVLLAILVGMIGLILVEYRGTNDLETVTESRWAPLFGGLVENSISKHEEHAAIEESEEQEASHEEEETDDHDEPADEHDGHAEEPEEPVSEEAVSKEELSQEEEEEEEEEEDSQPEESTEAPSDEDEEEEQQQSKEEGEEQEDSQEEVTDIPGVTESVEDEDEDEDEVEQSQEVSGEQQEEEEEDEASKEAVGNEESGEVGEADEQGEGEDESKEGTEDETEGDEQEEEEPEPAGVALKFGVGVALVIVAHVVLVRKWNSGQNIAPPQTPVIKSQPEEIPLEQPSFVENDVPQEVVCRRQTLIPEELSQPPVGEEEREFEDSEYSDEGQEDEAEEEQVQEEEEVEDVEEEVEDVEEDEEEEDYDEKTYESLLKKYAHLLPQDDTESEEEEEEGYVAIKGKEDIFKGKQKLITAQQSSGSEEEEVEEEEPQVVKIVNKELEEEEEESEEETEEETEDEELEKMEKSALPVAPLKSTTPQTSSPKIVEDDSKKGTREESSEGEDEEVPVAASSKATRKASGEQSYVNADVTNADDWIIRNELDKAEAELEEKPESALEKFSHILSKHPNSPRGLYGKARALDHLAEKQHSNRILEQGIAEYKNMLKMGSSVPDKLFLLASDRCINRMRFKGQHYMAIPIHRSLMQRFPDDPSHPNQLAVTFLMVNRLPEAKKVLEETLKKWPKNGFAQVHYGFILKTGDQNMTAAVDYLTNGIASREPGTIDGRFFFHLGDALLRLNRRDEAMLIHEIGVREGVFLSKYQRSLYNINRLKAQPWWTPQETTYAKYFKKLEENWGIIQSEGLNALYNAKLNLYKDETENLRDSGKWKQLELFARGRKIAENCVNAPQTCSLIEMFPAAKDCRRGQVKFSVMYAGTHVWPHCGPTNCRLRAHLGLVVPKETYIRVANKTRSWEEGKLLIFDDSFEHEVWHNGTTTRLVLIVDVWHPELTEEEKKSLPAI